MIRSDNENILVCIVGVLVSLGRLVRVLIF